MRRGLALLLCAVTLLGLCACGQGSALPEPSAPAAPSAAPAPTPEPTPTPMRVRYVIEGEGGSAPEPDPACFGSIGLDRPEQALELIRQARELGLLREDERVIFDPAADFYYDEDIEYYLDETILVLCWKEVVEGYTCSFAEVRIADPSQLRRKLADDVCDPQNRYFCTELHRQTNAVLSLNADFYQNRSLGMLFWNGELLRYPEGRYTGSYTMTDCLENCLVDERGDFLFTELGQGLSREEMEAYLAENHIRFSLAFGPVLVRDGQTLFCDWYPVGQISEGYSRAGIGQVDALHYLYMSLNHAPEKAGCWTVNEFARHFGEKGVKNAYCLDGGQTGEMVFQGRPYNHVDFGEERRVSDCIYFASALGGTRILEPIPDRAVFRLLPAEGSALPADCGRFDAGAGSGAVELLLLPDRRVTDLRILSLSAEEEEGKPVFRERELYAQPELSPERPLLLRLTFPGDLPSFGFAYTDPDGTPHRCAIALSGEDGSPVFWELEPENQEA